MSREIIQGKDNPIQIDWPHEAEAALWEQIDRAQKELGYKFGTAVKLAGYSFISSLGASTEVAPKYRKYEEIHETPKQRKRKGGGKKYKVTSWKGDRKKTYNVRSPKGVRELKKMSRVKIGMRGLAKHSWRYAGGMAGKKSLVRNIKVTGGVRRKSRELSSEQHNYKGVEPFITVTNRIEHIIPAMTSGKKTVDTAMNRAYRGMRKHIDKLIKRRLAR